MTPTNILFLFFYRPHEKDHFHYPLGTECCRLYLTQLGASLCVVKPPSSPSCTRLLTPPAARFGEDYGDRVARPALSREGHGVPVPHPAAVYGLARRHQPHQRE